MAKLYIDSITDKLTGELDIYSYSQSGMFEKIRSALANYGLAVSMDSSIQKEAICISMIDSIEGKEVKEKFWKELENGEVYDVLKAVETYLDT